MPTINSRAWVLNPKFGLEYLSLKQQQLEPPADDEVQLQVQAVSLNYRDLLVIDGKYNPKQPLPLVPCSDAAGQVVAVGSKVSKFAIADKVCPIFAQDWLCGPPNRQNLRSTLGSPRPGTLRTLLNVPEYALVPLPSQNLWTPSEAATFGCAGVTAFNALAGLTPGQTVVVLGTGGVSIFALQMAKAMGARVAVTSSSDEKLQRAIELGADFTVNYRRHEEWSRQILDWTEREGVDRVIEVGGAGTIAQSLRCLKPGGQAAMIGVLAGTTEPLSLLPLLMQQLTIRGVIVGNRQDFENCLAFAAQHRLQPVVDQRFKFEEAPQALAYLRAAQHLGKVVIEVDGS